MEQSPLMGTSQANPSMVPPLCFRCGADCSRAERFRDKQGRVYCGACAAKYGRVKTPGQNAPAGAPLAGEAQAADPAVTPLASQAAGDTFELAPAQETLRPSHHPRPDAVVMTGVDRCPRCNYPLAGLKTPKCPECGEVISPETARRERLRQASRETVRQAYLRPVIMFGVAFGGLMILRLATGQAGLIGRDLVAYAISVPVDVFAFWLCCLLFIGFDAPMHLTAMRLLGIYAVVDLVGELLGLTGMPVVGWAIPSFVWIGMLKSELDLDWSDAFIYSVVSSLVGIVGGVIAAAVL